MSAQTSVPSPAPATPVSGGTSTSASFGRPPTFPPSPFNPNAVDFKPQPRSNKAIKIVDPNSAKASSPTPSHAPAPKTATVTAPTTTPAAADSVKKAAEEKTNAAKEVAERERKEKEAEEQEAKVKAKEEAEARWQAEEKEKKEKEERERAEAEAKAKHEEEARIAKEKADQERVDAEKKRDEEAKAKAEAEAAVAAETAAAAAEASAAKAEEEAKAKVVEEEDKLKPPTTTPAPGSASSTAPTTADSSRATSPPAATSAAAALPTELDDQKKRPVPEPLDIPSANGPSRPTSSADGAAPPSSSASAALGSAKIIEDLNRVNYPNDIKSPRPELNSGAEPGKFRYDRDFLLQFMDVCKEKPEHLASLEAMGISAEGPQAGGIPPRSASASMRRGMPPPPGGRGPPMGGPNGGPRGAPAAGALNFHLKTSEERYARSSQGAPGLGSGFPGIPMRPPSMSRSSSSSQMMPGSGMLPQSASGRGDRRSGRGRSRGTGDRQPVQTPTMEHVAPLQESENAWKPRVGARAARDDPNSLDTVNRKVKALLNKLTLERFDSISDQILEWANKSKDEPDGRILRQVIALTFEKATDEATWSEMYARLCRKIMEKLSTDVTDEAVPGVFGGTLFRKYLLTRCQEDYERGWAQRDSTANAAAAKAKEDEAKRLANAKAEEEGKAAEGGADAEKPKEAEILSDEYYAAQKAKRRGLGLVRFIGELFKLQMLTPRIMRECITKLLANVDDPEEEDVESLCRLITTVGKQLEEEPKGPGLMSVYMERLGYLAVNQRVSSRIRFMVQVGFVSFL
jgi:translation initiation factor 4G